MPTPPKPGASPRHVISIDVESQTRPVGTPIRGGHQPRLTYDGDIFKSADISGATALNGGMKVTFKVRAHQRARARYYKPP